MIPYISANEYLKNKYGEKVYRLAINGGMTCPNRDGTLDSRGCIFCSAGGSGDFAGNAALSITEQIEAEKARVREKFSGNRYIAYFQAYTNTYAPTPYLERIFNEAAAHPEVVGLSIATRPDCLPEDVIDLLAGINRRKEVWVELGLQTIHEKTADYIRRGWRLPVYDEAVNRLQAAGIRVITHVILGLPGESSSDMLETVKYVADTHCFGIKLQLLHVLKGTDLAKDYAAGKFRVLTLEEYTDILKSALEILPSEMVVHRITGDGPKKLLLAPLWSADKKTVLNHINRTLRKSPATDDIPAAGLGIK